METPDDLREDLSALAPVDVDAQAARRLRRDVVAAFRREHASRRGAFASSAAHVWSRYGVPALLASAAVAYLSWAVSFTSALYR